MSRTILAVVAVVAIAAMMGVATVAPAYAEPECKEKGKFEVCTDIIPVSSSNSKIVCGILVDFERIFTFTNTMWDNGKFKFQEKIVTEFFAVDDGRLVAKSISVTNEQGTIPQEGPFVMQNRGMTNCLNNGPSETDHSGVTEIWRDGSVVHQNFR